MIMADTHLFFCSFLLHPQIFHDTLTGLKIYTVDFVFIS